MKNAKLFQTIANGVHALVRVLTWIASGALGILILFVVANILSRFLFKKPLPGTIEIIELVAVVIVFFSVAYTESKRAHIYVELVVSKLSQTHTGSAGEHDVPSRCGLFCCHGMAGWSAGLVLPVSYGQGDLCPLHPHCSLSVCDSPGKFCIGPGDADTRFPASAG